MVVIPIKPNSRGERRRASNNAAPVIVGELWDAALVMQAYQLDLQTNFNGHNYTNITDNSVTGSLFVATS